MTTAPAGAPESKATAPAAKEKATPVPKPKPKAVSALKQGVKGASSPALQARLQKLKKALVDQPTASEAARAEFFAVHAQTSLINLFADPVEKCREFAIGIVNALAAMAPLVRQKLERFFVPRARA